MSNSSKIFKRRQVMLDNETFVVSIPSKGDCRLDSEGAEQLADSFVVGSDDAIETIELSDEGTGTNAEPDMVELAIGEVLDDARAEAKTILDNARSSADAIILEAYDQAEEIRAKAKEEGYQEGIEACERKCQDKLDEEVQELLLIRKQLEHKKRELYIDAENDIIFLVLDSVKKILGQYVEKDEEYIEELVKTAMIKVTKSREIVLRVSTEDVEKAERIRTRLILGCDRVDDIEIKRDISLSEGQCIIETERGSIDASIEGQVRKLTETFQQVLNESRMDLSQQGIEAFDDY